ncbi:FAD-dependent oxidoreductase [Wenjunlia tyrosinilytica]|uniref:ferredoxin--NADP(+) reductase n=1 Tax=Wenjunlia tyrosinilytica TaxID=1544741 RepID=A0A917ZSX7_9ACTN|nr:FAD-dependent oxidoreductase [Wenjunlia tyrosinilytica]GGO91057.1 NADP oxidoreductase [Wenjunlia tyrosinilytica]
MLRVAVVGSGPAGIYTAEALTRHEDVLVDVIDRLPCPFGLVRYGVAPDHEKIKSIQATLCRVLEHPRVRFLGNVHVGRDVGPERLRALYNAVVYCFGASSDRRLGVPGEDLPGSFSATRFVSWYSAHPDTELDAFTLNARSVAVIGVGNVAVDVARILSRGAEELRATDVPDHCLRSLGESRVEDVHMIGRRGPSQAKFTTKELRELGELAGADVVVREDELALDPGFAAPSASAPAVRRNLDVLREWAGRPLSGRPRRVHVRFFLRPAALLGEGSVRAVRLERTAPDAQGGVSGTGEFEDLPAQMVLRSIGYQGVELMGLPFDPRRAIVPNEDGRVLREGLTSPGEYVAGWIKRGPTGVIGTNRPDGKQTAAAVLEDASASLLGDAVTPDPLEELRSLGLDPVPWAGWLAIEAAEAVLGASSGRAAAKIPDWEGLLKAARNGTNGKAAAPEPSPKPERRGLRRT